MLENLLTPQEIQLVLQSARLNSVLRNPNVISFGSEKTSLYKISPNHGIIFIKGDSYTGFTHIHERHDYWSEKYFWKQDNDKVKLDNPSKFSRKIIPITDYIQIADDLFIEENINKEKNKSPDIFEMYSGVINEGQNSKAKYHMLLYKNTRIIHTLYPDKRKHNKKITINYVRGNAKGELRLNPSGSTIAIPYMDHKKNVVYSFQIIKDFEANIEIAVIINHKQNQRAKLFERPIEIIDELHADVEMMQNSDLSKIEEIINQLERDNK